MMDRHQREALDRHITGNYGEDQFRNGDYASWRDEPFFPECQVSNCEEDSTDGVLCDRHQEEQET